MPPDSVVVAPGVNLSALGLDASDVTMDSNGGNQEDKDEGRAAHYAAPEDEVEGLLEDGPDDAADILHTGAGEYGGSGDGDGDGDAPLGAALLPGDVCEAMGRAAAALFSPRL